MGKAKRKHFRRRILTVRKQCDGSVLNAGNFIKCINAMVESEHEKHKNKIGAPHSVETGDVRAVPD